MQHAHRSELVRVPRSTLRCGADISCQPPVKYANRFLDFIYKA